jgi:cytochrome b561
MSTPAQDPWARPPHADGITSALHRLLAVLILASFAIAFLALALPADWVGAILGLHKVLGVAVLLVVGICLAWRAHHAPAPTSAGPLGRFVADLAQAGLYFLIAMVAVMGLVDIVVRGQGLDFGVFAIGPFTPGHGTMAAQLRGLHALAAYTLLYGVAGVAAAHALAALWRRYVRRPAGAIPMLPAE